LNIDGISTIIVKLIYSQQIIVPGEYYDNNNRDITKIKILFTKDEIRSNYLEFLSSIDLDQLYFLNDSVVYYLNIQFYLPCYDIFGKLKEILRGLINTITDNPTLLDNLKLSLRDIQVYSYTKVYIGYVSFNRSRGIEVYVLFN